MMSSCNDVARDCWVYLSITMIMMCRRRIQQKKSGGKPAAI